MLGSASFPGVSQVLRARFTLSHGVTPSVASLVIAPQPGLPRIGGTLRFEFGPVLLDFPECRIDLASFQRSQRGETWTLHLLDRRWKWAFGEISGLYNARRADGTLEPGTERTPRELARLCCDALGEAEPLLDGLPEEPRPAVHWQCARPAAALADLCESLGCRVVLTLDSRLAVVRTGDGAELPLDGAVMADSGALDPPERPDALVFTAAPTRYQAQFTLEAVGLETDGRILPIDKLSYKPSRGWGSLPADADDWQAISDPLHRRLAERSVFRWYRIARHRDGTLRLPGQREPLESIAQVLPLAAERVEQFTDVLDDRRRNRGPRVLGAWFTPELDGANLDLTRDHEYERPFRVDHERGIVMFARPVVLERTESDAATSGARADEVRWKPARLYLETAFSLHDARSRAPERYRRERRLPPPVFGTPPRVLRDERAALTHVARYRDGQLTDIVTNERAVRAYAEQTLEWAAREYETAAAHEVRYAGLAPIGPDGAIQQVTWEVACGQGATTCASRNSEHALGLPSYRERRVGERMKDEG